MVNPTSSPTNKNTSTGSTDEEKTENKSIKSKVISVLVVLAVVGLTRGLIVFFTEDHGNGSVKEKAQSILTSTDMKEYSSVEHRFKILFPGFPEIVREKIPIGEYEIPMTMYTKELNDGNTAYLAAVYDYASQGFAHDDIDLEGGLNGMVQNTGNGRLITSKFSTFRGMNSIEGHAKTDISGTSYDMYANLFGQNGKMFALVTIGADKAAYDSFVNSFELMN